MQASVLVGENSPIPRVNTRVRLLRPLRFMRQRLIPMPYSVALPPTPTLLPTHTTAPSPMLRPSSTTPTPSRWLSPPRAVMSLRTVKARLHSPLLFIRQVRRSMLKEKALIPGPSTTKTVLSTPLGVQAERKRAKPSRFRLPT